MNFERRRVALRLSALVVGTATVAATAVAGAANAASPVALSHRSVHVCSQAPAGSAACQALVR